MTSALDRFFRLTENRSNVRTELTAGLTTFAAMAYILAVNPQILSAAGMDFGAVVTATALASHRRARSARLIYAAFQIGVGRARQVSLTAWLLAALFVLHIVFR